MISSPRFMQVNTRFREYLKSLQIPDATTQNHINFKVDHTYRVVNNILILAKETGMSDGDTELAAIIALLHDVGRFEQFIRHKTFDDKTSVNHAALGVEIMQTASLLNGEMTEEEHKLVYKAILNHNLSALDHALDERTLHFSKLIRDADKLDIWEIMTSRDVVFTIIQEEKAAEYHVPDAIYQSFQSGQIVPGVCAHSMNDFRLLRLSWIYDMNFPATYQLILQRDYVSKIMVRIPPSERLTTIAGIIRQHIVRQAGSIQH
jgi:putative nucleotidyltransferase with HDIG domain